MGLFTSLLLADTPVLWGKDRGTHDKLVAEAAAYGATITGGGVNRNYRQYRLACGHEQEIRTCDMRIGRFRCQTCLVDKLAAEAAAQKATIAGKGKHKDYLRYLMSCGHEQEVETGKMRTGRFRCRACLADKLVVEAVAQGSTIIGKGKNKGYRRYRLTCGHEQEVETGKMRSGEFACQTCLADKFVVEAAAHGAVIAGRGKNTDRRRYRLTCSHEQEIQISAMRTGEFACQTCLADKLVVEAAAQKATIVGRGENKGYRRYLMACGHAQEIRTSDMRIGNFRCHTCEESWATKPSNLYLHEIRYGDTTLLKFGRAQNVEVRAKQYGLPAEATVRTLHTWSFTKGLIADRIETLVGRIVPRLDRELASQVLTASGSTECFHVKHAALIIDVTDGFHAIRPPVEE